MPVRAITCVVCVHINVRFFASKCVRSYVRESVCVCVLPERVSEREREIAAGTASEFALPVQHKSCAGMGQPVIHCSR